VSARVAVVSTEKRWLKSVRETVGGGTHVTLRAVFDHRLACGHETTRSTICKHVTCKRCA
jgi:hypothetical protein